MDHGSSQQILFRKEVYALVGAALEVLRELGLNYLRITRLPVGVILNFRYARLEWERLVKSDERDNANQMSA